MIIGGFIPFSLLDYPGRIAAVIFTRGCNFRCPYCQNPELVSGDSSHPGIGESEILHFLSTRVEKLDGVVISGGEPTWHDDLAGFIRELKSMGFMVKLDTNGGNPEHLALLIESGLLDYIAMDVKTDPARYSQALRAAVEKEKLLESVRLIRDCPDYEFRTTVVPGIVDTADLLVIAQHAPALKAG